MQLINGLLLQVSGRRSFQTDVPVDTAGRQYSRYTKGTGPMQSDASSTARQYSRRDTGLSLAYSVIKVFVRITNYIFGSKKPDSDQIVAIFHWGEVVRLHTDLATHACK